MKTFAVRIGDYVEFRAAKRPPQIKVTRLTRMVKVLEHKYTYEPPYYVRVYVDRKHTLKTMFPIGGRVLGGIKYSKYSRFTAGAANAPKFGKRRVVEISKELLTTFMRSNP